MSNKKQKLKIMLGFFLNWKNILRFLFTRASIGTRNYVTYGFALLKRMAGKIDKIWANKLILFQGDSYTIHALQNGNVS